MVFGSVLFHAANVMVFYVLLYKMSLLKGYDGSEVIYMVIPVFLQYGLMYWYFCICVIYMSIFINTFAEKCELTSRFSNIYHHAAICLSQYKKLKHGLGKDFISIDNVNINNLRNTIFVSFYFTASFNDCWPLHDCFCQLLRIF